VLRRPIETTPVTNTYPEISQTSDCWAFLTELSEWICGRCDFISRVGVGGAGNKHLTFRGMYSKYGYRLGALSSPTSIHMSSLQ